jgi:hypothetical protein
MSRPRTPTNVLTLKGAFGKHPERARARADEPQPHGEVGPAPKHLSVKERACFEEIVGMCPPGVLGASDRLVLEHGARILAQLRRNRTYVDTRLMTRFEAVLGRLGLTPADRSRVATIKPRGEARNRFAALAARNRS